MINQIRPLSKIRPVWLLTLPVILTFSLIASCKKKSQQPNPNITRTLKFIVSTESDFTGLQDSIFISMRIEKTRPITVLWESNLPAMQLEDLPKYSERIEYIKEFSTTDTSLLRFGFRYTIKDVGQFWKYDSVGIKELNKQIHLNFK